MRIFVVFATILLLFLTDCTAANMEIPKESMAKIHRVAVVSVLWDEIRFQRVGFTIFNNVDNYYPLSQWDINQKIESVVRTTMKKNKDVQLVEINFDREKLQDIYKSRGEGSGSAPFDRHYIALSHAPYNFKYIDSYLRQIVESNQVDTLIVIAENYGFAKVGSIETHVQGIAEINDQLGATTDLCFRAEIVVIDTHTLETISKTLLYTQNNLDNNYWQDDLTKLSNNQVEHIKETLFTGLDSNIPSALAKFGFVPSEK